jgi:hypothetical protein
MNMVQRDFHFGLTFAEELFDFVQGRIEGSKEELAKRPFYDEDRSHWAGQVFAYEVVLREIEHLSRRTCRPNPDLISPG